MKLASEISEDWFLSFHDFIYSIDELEPIRPILPLSKEEFSDPKRRNKAIFNAKNHIQASMNTPLRNAFTLAVKFFIQSHYGLSIDIKETEELLNIKQVGYTSVPAIEDDLMQRLRSYLDTLTVYQGSRQSELQPTDMLHAPNYNMVRYQVYDLIKSIDILYAATSDRFLPLAECYMEHPVIITNISSWWSFGGHPIAQNAQNFHIDLDDFRFCKGFIYMTDVDDDSGPHCYHPKTHDLARLQKSLVDHEDPKAFINWYVNELRKTDDDCIKYLGNTPVNLTGPAGSSLLVDTSGIHKGLLPKTKDRLIIQFEYSQTCFPQTPIRLIPFSEFIKQRPELSEHFLQPNVKYALQLIIDYDA